MYVFFADDAKQNQPSREHMGGLVASGGLFVDGDELALMEHELNDLCITNGFPRNEEFKWSPRRNTWMHHNLVEGQRREFFSSVIRICTSHNAKAIVIICDSQYRIPGDCTNHEMFVTKMLLERVNNLANSVASTAIVVVDRPGGGIAEERKFLSECLHTLQEGTPYVMPEKIAVNPISTDSHLIRTLQASDLIVSCTTALVAGQTTLAPDIFESIKPILAQDLGRIGGVGVKIHPDFVYLNLYHWLLGDDMHVRNMNGTPLPFLAQPYSNSPNQYR